MAITRAPHPQGSITTLRGPRDSQLHVTAPNGLTLTIPAPNGKADLWLPQPGDWHYQWDNGPAGTITVQPTTTAQPTANTTIRTKPNRPRRWT